MGDFISQEEIDALLNGGLAQKNDGNSLTLQENSAMEELAGISIESYVGTLSMVLDKKMDVSKPRISEVTINKLCEKHQGRFVAIRVDYTKGLKGSNFIVFPEDDVKRITDVMMGGDGTNVSDEINALHLSAIGEAMNQMVGSAANAVSGLIKSGIDILPPKATMFTFEDSRVLLKEFAGQSEDLVEVSFDINAEGLLKCEVLQLLPYGYCRDTTNLLSGKSKATEPPKPASTPAQQAPQQMQQPQQTNQPDPMNTQYPGPMQPMYGQPQPGPNMAYYPEQQQYGAPQSGYYPPQQGGYPQFQGQGGAPGSPGGPGGPQQPNSRQPVNVQPANFQAFEETKIVFEKRNVDIIMDVPLQVTVELGRTNRLIKDILEFATGTIIELDKLAGEPVDILVNGKIVAKGEVVVIDESFGVRITEIVHPSVRL